MRMEIGGRVGGQGAKCEEDMTWSKHVEFNNFAEMGPRVVILERQVGNRHGYTCAEFGWILGKERDRASK